MFTSAPRPLTSDRSTVRPAETGLLHSTRNWNLVNLAIDLFGPCTESVLCVRLLLFQGACVLLGFGVRAVLAGHYK